MPSWVAVSGPDNGNANADLTSLIWKPVDLLTTGFQIRDVKSALALPLSPLQAKSLRMIEYLGNYEELAVLAADFDKAVIALQDEYQIPSMSEGERVTLCTEFFNLYKAALQLHSTLAARGICYTNDR